MIPSKFKIANQWITVKKQQTVYIGKDCVFGCFFSVKNEILIATHINTIDGLIALTEEQMRNSFYHELMHCFNFFWDTGSDECLAQSFANFICEYLDSKE